MKHITTLENQLDGITEQGTGTESTQKILLLNCDL